MDEATLRAALAPHVFDGTEGGVVIRELSDAVADAKGDINKIAEAEAIAGLRLIRLLGGLVPVEAVLDVLARLQDQNSFSEIMLGYIATQLKFRREPPE
jgi:hypothetical protein